MVSDDGGGNFVHLKAAISFGNFHAAQTEIARLFQEVSRNREILVLHLLCLGQDFIDRELFRGLSNHLLLLGEIFRSKHVGYLPFFQQKAAAQNLGLWDRRSSHERDLHTSTRKRCALNFEHLKVYKLGMQFSS